MFDNGAGSLNSADLYGSPAWSSVMPDPIGSIGPNQGAVTASGDGNLTDSGNGAAFSWVGFVLLLVGLRVAIELSDRA